MKHHFFGSLLLMLAFASAAMARDRMNYVRYTTADGMPASRVTSMCEDLHGIIWMNTWNGLCKWDGRKMTGYISTADGVRFGRTTGIEPLEDGRLVFWNDHRERLCFDPRTERLCPLPDTLVFVPQPESDVEPIEEVTGLGFRRNGVAYHLPYDDGLRMERQLHHAFEDSKGQLWFDFNNSLYRIWFEPSPFCLFQQWPEGQHCQFQSTVRALAVDDHGNLIAASRNYKMYGLNDSVTEVPFPGNVYEMVHDVSHNRLWLALRKKGLYSYTADDGLQPAMPDLAAAGLSDLFSLLELRDQPYLWCGTWGDGVRIVDVHGEQAVLKRTLCNDSLKSIHKMIQLRSGLVGVCSTRGFHIYSATGAPVYVVGPDLDVLSAVELPDDRVYLSALGKGQFYMETNGRLTPDMTTQIDDRISAMYMVGDSVLWMVSDTRLFRYNFVRSCVDQLDGEDFGPHVNFAENAIALCHDSLLYIGASSGMFEVNLNEIDAYLLARDVERAELHRQKLVHRILLVVIIVLIVALVVSVTWFWMNKKVKRAKANQQVILPANARDAEQENREFVERLTVVMNQMIGNQDADISQLAVQMGMPKNAFYVRCNEALHSTPAAILQDMRIEYAKKMMQKGDVSVKEVSFRVGFNDPKYFSKVFRNKTGMTPSQFLENFAKK